MNPIEARMTGYATDPETTREGTSLPVTLGYDPGEDPLTVTMLVENGEEGGVVWELGRQLFADAVDSTGGRVGLGDVKMRKQHAMLIICLNNPNGHAHLALRLDEVKRFVMETILSTPLGSECLDEAIDEFLEEVLGA